MKAKREPTTLRKELVREEILTKAADVFEKKGYAQTTIFDVAQALDLSRSALYHYFKSKDEILEALVIENTGQAAEEMEQRVSRLSSPSDRLRELLSSSINGRMTRGARLRVLDQLTAEMPAEIRQKFDQGRRRVLDLYTRLIQAGIDAGELRRVDARTAALAILGIASWTSWWYSPTGRKSPEELAELLVDIAFHGLTRPPTDRAGTQSPKDLVRALKRNLADLEKVIDKREGS